MFKRLKKLVNKLLGRAPASPAPREPGKPQYGDKVGNVTIERYAQLVKHTEYKPGEQYRLGEGIVTVHEDKSSMYMALLRVETNMFLKHAALTKKAEDMMMMSPEELQVFKVTEWLASNKAKGNVFSRIMGRFWSKGRKDHYFTQLEAKYPPEVKKQQIKEVNSTVKEKVKVKV